MPDRRPRALPALILAGVALASVGYPADGPGGRPRLAAAQPSRSLDPSAWGGDHVGRALPELTSGDECLFCHRPDRGPGYAENPHCRSLRPAVEDDLRPLRADPALKSSSAEVVYTLGGGPLVRFLKPAGQSGKLELWGVAWAPAKGDRPGRLLHAESPRWDAQTFGRDCAGCHATA